MSYYKMRYEMDAAILSLISAIGVVVVTQIFLYIRDRITHKEAVQDKREDKHDEVMDELKSINVAITDLRYQISCTEMKQARIRILRFEDETLTGTKHSKSHWNQLMNDIDVYLTFCEQNPKFKNGVAKHAINHLQKLYDELCQNGEFLTEEYIVPNTGKYTIKNFSNKEE